MALADVKEKFIELSGRADLEDDENVVKSEFFINAGQKYLDGLLEQGKTVARYFTNLITGQILVPIENLRAVQTVWVADGEERTQLHKVDMEHLRRRYNIPKSSLDSGRPRHYAPAILRPFGEVLDIGTLTYSWLADDILASGHETKKGIVIYAPADVVYTLEVWGKFWSKTLSEPTDTSFWTENHEDLLIKAALREVEIFHRNTEGQKDWELAIGFAMMEINKDAIEEEIAEIDQLGG